MILAGLVAVYFLNIEVQSYLGRRAMQESGMNPVKIEEALEFEEGLILAQFSADWCGACRQMTEHVVSKPKVKSYINQHYTFSYVEFEEDENKQYFNKYAVGSLPTFLILSPSGDLIRRISYTLDADSFLKQIELSSKKIVKEL